LIFLISVSWIARITGVSHWRLAREHISTQLGTAVNKDGDDLVSSHHLFCTLPPPSSEIVLNVTGWQCSVPGGLGPNLSPSSLTPKSQLSFSQWANPSCKAQGSNNKVYHQLPHHHIADDVVTAETPWLRGSRHTAHAWEYMGMHPREFVPHWKPEGVSPAVPGLVTVLWITVPESQFLNHRKSVIMWNLHNWNDKWQCLNLALASGTPIHYPSFPQIIALWDLVHSQFPEHALCQPPYLIWLFLLPRMPCSPSSTKPPLAHLPRL
jgi:hypothetical protein